MKLQACLDIAKDCGLTHLSEAYSNVTLHYSSLFIHDKANDEIKELADAIIALGLVVDKTIVDTTIVEVEKLLK